MKSLRHVLLATLALLLACSAFGQELKIGVVNVDRILRDASPAKAAQAKLDAEFKRRDTDLVDAETRLRQASEKFDKEAPTMADSERVRRQRDLLDQNRELQRKRGELMEDFSQRKNEELSQLYDKVGKVVKQIAELEKYDLVVQEPFYASARIDLTDKVIKAMNAGTAK
jgi:outer membrane protein